MNSKDVIGSAHPHTVKKFELIESYVKAWKEKLLNTLECRHLVFIDCMCSSGENVDDGKETVFGTPVRVDNLLCEAASRYPDKNIHVIFNDIDIAKIKHLKSIIHEGTNNYHVSVYNQDCNVLLPEIWQKISLLEGVHCLLVYDPYQASINWDALKPFLNNWKK